MIFNFILFAAVWLTCAVVFILSTVHAVNQAMDNGFNPIATNTGFRGRGGYGRKSLFSYKTSCYQPHHISGQVKVPLLLHPIRPGHVLPQFPTSVLVLSHLSYCMLRYQHYVVTLP